MFMIEIRTQDNKVRAIAVTYNSDVLFDILMILETSEKVKEFKVSNGAATTLVEGNFGWGKFQKWVIEFKWNQVGWCY